MCHWKAAKRYTTITKTLLDKFAALQKTCTDSFNIHTKSMKTNGKEMTLDNIGKYDSRSLLSVTLIPVKKICKRCEMELNTSTDEFGDDQGKYSHDDSSFFECSVETANQYLTSLDCTPLQNISEALEQPSLSGVDSYADCEQLMYELKEN